MGASVDKMRFCRAGLAILLVLLAVCSVQAGAEVDGVIIRTDDQQFRGLMHWDSQIKRYVLVSKRGAAGGVTIEVQFSPGDVKSLTVTEPPGLQSAAQLVRDGKIQPAIVALEKVAQDYDMLQWDAPAMRWLAEAYIRDGKPEQAVRACERVTDTRPDMAIAGEMAAWYWRALLAAGRNNILEDLLKKADESPHPGWQARANNMHGELLRRQTRSREALRDGYLRTVVLFKGARDPALRDARAEALYKAAQCFDDLGLGAPAIRMRSACIDEHADSDWARRLKAGEQ